MFIIYSVLYLWSTYTIKTVSSARARWPVWPMSHHELSPVILRPVVPSWMPWGFRPRLRSCPLRQSVTSVRTTVSISRPSSRIKRRFQNRLFSNPSSECSKKEKHFSNFISLLSSARRKKQRSIHPLQTSPYIGRLKKIIAETVDYFYVLVSRDDAMSFSRLAHR